jgi:hypothetical protein
MPKVAFSKIIEKHIEVTKARGFWSKETKLLKKLIEKYPNLEFWQKTEFRPKLKSFAQLMVEPLEEYLRVKYRDFHRVSRKDEDIVIYDKKFGKDITRKNKPQSIRSFLNG